MFTDHCVKKLNLHWKISTAWKVSKYGAFLVRIFPYLDWIRKFTDTQSKYGKIRTKKPPNLDTFHAVDSFQWRFNFSVISMKAITFNLFGFYRDLLSKKIRSFLLCILKEKLLFMRHCFLESQLRALICKTWPG